MDDKVYIILLNYNNYEDTINCVQSIEKNELGLNYKIVVVDNCSTDDSALKLEKIKNIVFIASKENGGFAKGNNIGIEYAMKDGADYILLLNNDTVIEKQAISKMINKIKGHKDIGILGSRTMYYDNPTLINYNGGHINWLKAITVHEGYKEEFKNEGQDFKYTDFITGCCMLIKREVIEKVGMLPEEYFMYYEDVDYCMKTIEAGYKLGVSMDTIIYHKVSSSSGGENSPFSIKWGNRNRLIFINKYKKYTKGILTTFVYYITRFILVFKYILKHDMKRKQAIIDGIKEGRKYLKGNR